MNIICIDKRVMTVGSEELEQGVTRIKNEQVSKCLHSSASMNGAVSSDEVDEVMKVRTCLVVALE